MSNNINLIVDLINSSKLAEARINIENELKYNKNKFTIFNSELFAGKLVAEIKKKLQRNQTL